jgi:hypothetical protein
MTDKFHLWKAQNSRVSTVAWKKKAGLQKKAVEKGGGRAEKGDVQFRGEWCLGGRKPYEEWLFDWLEGRKWSQKALEHWERCRIIFGAFE